MKVYDLEELVLYKGMLVYITDNKTISISQVLYSQGLLAILKEFNLDNTGKLYLVSVILLPLIVRFYLEVADS